MMDGYKRRDISNELYFYCVSDLYIQSPQDKGGKLIFLLDIGIRAVSIPSRLNRS